MAVDALIRMDGSAFGLRLSVEEVVTERTPPSRKTSRTIGAPRLLIVGGYEMGFRLSNLPAGCELVVWIDFWPPSGVIGALLGRLLGCAYARWCVDRIVADATRAFGRRT